jgi:hypothetical protein
VPAEATASRVTDWPLRMEGALGVIVAATAGFTVNFAELVDTVTGEEELSVT